MSADSFDELENRVTSLINVLNELKLENAKLKSENVRLAEDRVALKARIDAILKKLEGV